MSAKKVKLICGDQTAEFSFDTAQSLLYIRQEMNRVMTKKKEGWKLPDDSPYEFVNNGLIKRTDTGNSKKPTASRSDSEGKTAPK